MNSAHPEPRRRWRYDGEQPRLASVLQTPRFRATKKCSQVLCPLPILANTGAMGIAGRNGGELNEPPGKEGEQKEGSP